MFSVVAKNRFFSTLASAAKNASVSVKSGIAPFVANNKSKGKVVREKRIYANDAGDVEMPAQIVYIDKRCACSPAPPTETVQVEKPRTRSGWFSVADAALFLLVLSLMENPKK